MYPVLPTAAASFEAAMDILSSVEKGEGMFAYSVPFFVAFHHRKKKSIGGCTKPSNYHSFSGVSTTQHCPIF